VVVILEYSVDRYGCRLKHCALLVWNGLVKRNCILLRNYYIISIASLLSGTDEAVMFAEGEVPLLTVITFHAWKKWSSGYTVADFDFCHAFTDFYYIAGKFMSKNNRIEVNSVVENTRDVRSADAGVSDFNLYGSFGYLWFFDFLILYLFVCCYYCCFHKFGAPFVKGGKLSLTYKWRNLILRNVGIPRGRARRPLRLPLRFFWKHEPGFWLLLFLGEGVLSWVFR